MNAEEFIEFEEFRRIKAIRNQERQGIWWIEGIQGVLRLLGIQKDSDVFKEAERIQKNLRVSKHFMQFKRI